MHSFARLAQADFALFVGRENIQQATTWVLYAQKVVTRAMVVGGRSSPSPFVKSLRVPSSSRAEQHAHVPGVKRIRKKKGKRGRGQGRVARRKAERTSVLYSTPDVVSPSFPGRTRSQREAYVYNVPSQMWRVNPGVPGPSVYVPLSTTPIGGQVEPDYMRAVPQEIRERMANAAAASRAKRRRR